MTPTNQQDRNQRLTEFIEVKAKIAESSGKNRIPKRKKAELVARRDELKKLYFDTLPLLPLSRCPFCHTVYQRRFDPWGTDGIWWQESELTIALKEPGPCVHFILLRGAIRFNKKKLLPSFNNAYLGPGVPYVVPDILNLATVKAVISDFEMDCGYTAFPISYFAETKPEPRLLMQEWRKKTYGWKDEQGNPVWTVPDWEWDFELGPWIDEKKIGWFDLSDLQNQVQFGSKKSCPYFGLRGTRQKQNSIRGKLCLVPPPKPNQHSPFE